MDPTYPCSGGDVKHDLGNAVPVHNLADDKGMPWRETESRIARTVSELAV